MSTLGRRVLLAMIPVNLAMLLWVWFGRIFFGAGGWFLDGWVHTRPLFTIIGAFVGGFAGFMSIYYRVKRDTAAKRK